MSWQPLDWLLMPDVVGPALEVELEVHPSSADCPNGGPDGECMVCGMRDCPHGEPLHYHHDGCPACWVEEQQPVSGRSEGLIAPDRGRHRGSVPLGGGSEGSDLPPEGAA